MRLWPTAYPKKCTYDDVRFFQLLCLGHEAQYPEDIEVHVGASPFGFCKSLLGSGAFARSILEPLSKQKHIGYMGFGNGQTALLKKGLKRHFGLKTESVSNWLSALQSATESIRFLKAFDAAETSFSAGWLKKQLSSQVTTEVPRIKAHIRNLSSTEVSGYAFDETNPSRSLLLDFFVNDSFVGSCKTAGANRVTEDETGGNAQAEFTHTISLPPHIELQDRLYVSVYEHESGALIYPASEIPRPDIRHALLIEKLNRQLKQAGNNEDIKATVEQVQKSLPDLHQFSALPLADYARHRELYRTPTPQLADGLLPNISIARAPDYEYDSKADVVIFLDEGATLKENAVEWVQFCAATKPEVFVFYAHYEVANDEGVIRPVYRTEFDLDLFLQQTHDATAYAVRHSQLEEVGGLNTDEPEPHISLWLRLLERHSPDGFQLVPHMLWQVRERGHDREVLQHLVSDFLERTETGATAVAHSDKYGGALPDFLNVEWPIDPLLPKLAIVIPMKDAVELTKNCVNSIRDTLEYRDHTEIIIVDNGSEKEETKSWLESISSSGNIQVIQHNAPFNWAELNNLAVEQSDAEYFLFLNNDTVALDKGWDRILRGHLHRSDIGIIGARLLFADGTIQFGGYILNPENIALKEAYCEATNVGGYNHRSQLTHTSSAIIGAFMACRRDVYQKVGGFDAERFPVAFNDIDFCMSASAAGYRNLYVPAITFHHLESKSRGYDALDKAKAEREKNERQNMREKWGDMLESDPWYPTAFVKREPTHSLLAVPTKASIRT